MTDQFPHEIAPSKAMEWAREAQGHEESRKAETGAMNRLVANPEAGPSRGARIQYHENVIRVLIDARNEAVAMAHMWSAVAAVQEQP